MTNLEAYVLEMEKTNSSPCYVPTKTLRSLLDVVEAAMEKLKIIYGHNLEAEQPCNLLKAMKKLDKARRG